MTVNESSDIYAVGVPIILLLIALEVVITQFQGRSVYRREDSLASLGLLAGNMLVSLGTKAGILAFSFYLYQFRLVTLNQMLPIWLMWVLTFIAIDLVFYFYHRLSHRCRLLWTIHMSHHSSEQMNFLVAFRQAWLGPISKIPFFAVLPLFGFDPGITAIAGVASTLWGVTGHTRMVDKLGPVEWLFNTPSHHRVHHGSNPEYIDKNYGNLLIIWDRLFGTFELEQAPVVYGLRKNVNTFNPMKITLMDWQAMLRDIRQANGLKEIFGHLLGPPDWQPGKRIRHSEL